MDCKYGYKCFDCPLADCNVEEESLSTETAKKMKRAQYNRTYYQKHQSELNERAKQRARRLKAEGKYQRFCKHCNKEINLKKGVVVFRKKYFCSKECLKNYLLSKVKDDVKDLKIK